MSLLGSMKTVVVILKPRSVLIDNRVFQLHYKLTVAILIAYSVIVTTKEYTGSPIECMVDAKSKVPKDFMEAYCWVHSTYTVLNLLDADEGTDVAHPGVGQLNEGDDVKFHRYYQWVGVIVVLQALCFYAPRLLWKSWEGDRVKMLVMEFQKVMSDQKLTLEKRTEGIEKHLKLVVEYFTCRPRKSSNLYAFRYFFCELINTLNVLMQLYLVNFFLGFEFTTYGIDAMIFTESDPFTRTDPMARVFPKVTKCIFQKYGPGGNVIPYDALCLLPVNVFNEKFYVFLYFWLIFLAAVSVVSLLVRILTCTIPALRHYRFVSKARLADPSASLAVAKHYDIGDWFLLIQMERNMDAMIFRDLVQRLAKHLKDNAKIKV